MGRHGNPYDNATAESFMKTLKVEAIYPMAFDAVQDVVDQPSGRTGRARPRFCWGDAPVFVDPIAASCL
jgi:hypothetical protein